MYISRVGYQSNQTGRVSNEKGVVNSVSRGVRPVLWVWQSVGQYIYRHARREGLQNRGDKRAGLDGRESELRGGGQHVLWE